MLEDLISERKKKLANLTAAGFYPYPEEVERTHLISEALADFMKFVAEKKSIFICGRITGMRDQGKIVFYDVVDETGKIQGIIKVN